MNDSDLIHRVLAGDSAAERALYDRHVDAVYQISLRIAGDVDVAADYTQETFIRAFTRLRQYRGESPFGAWLRAIAASVVLTGERKRTRFVRAVDLDLIADHARRTRHSSFDVTDRVANALDKMSEKFRSVFLMHDVEGYTHRWLCRARVGATVTGSQRGGRLALHFGAPSPESSQLRQRDRRVSIGRRAVPAGLRRSERVVLDSVFAQPTRNGKDWCGRSGRPARRARRSHRAPVVV